MGSIMFKVGNILLYLSKVLCVVTLALIMISCSTTTKMYSGPELPASQTALVQGAAGPISIEACDGVKVTSSAITVLPGEHTIWMSLNQIGSVGEYYSTGNIPITFIAEAGHTYGVDVSTHRNPYALIKDNTTGEKVAFSSHKQKYEENVIKRADIQIQKNPTNVYAWTAKANSLIRLERYNEALPILDEAISINPKFVKSWFNKSWALSELKRYEDALVAIDKAIQLEPYVQWWQNGRKLIMNAIQGLPPSREQLDDTFSKVF
jgi:hypothetical protein